MSDEALALAYLAALAAGDLVLAAQLRDQLWEQLLPRAESLARHWLRYHRYQLEDLVSEAWIRFQAVAHRWDGTRGVPFWGWLRSILINHFNDLHRRRCVTPTKYLGEPCEDDEIERMRSDLRIQLAWLRQGPPRRARWLDMVDCAERHWLDGIHVRQLATDHGVRQGMVYRWIEEVRRECQ